MDGPKKKTRTPASNRAQYKYNASHIKRVPLDVQITEYETIKAHAETYDDGMVNSFIKRAIREQMKRDLETSEN